MSRGAVERGNMPPGIERLLTEAEFEQLGWGRTRTMNGATRRKPAPLLMLQCG